GGRPYFAMEYVASGSLSARLAGTPQPFADAARLVATLARAVHYAHTRGVVHRDLKPSNVLLASEGREDLASGGRERPVVAGTGADPLARVPPAPLAGLVPKIADFGLAKDLGGNGSGPSETGDVLGTPSYMAPEQARGHVRAIGPATDVYALGAVLYECLTGR